MKSKIVKVCQNCGSENIKGVYTMSPSEQALFNVNNKMLVAAPQNIDFCGCKDCGFYGPAINIPQNKLKSFQNQRKNKKEIQRAPSGINKNKKAVKIISLILLIGWILSLLSIIFLEETPIFLYILGGMAIVTIILLIIFLFFSNQNNSIEPKSI